MHTRNEQKLVDSCYQIADTVRRHPDYFGEMSTEEVAAWVSKQLDDCGFKTIPIGASWGMLTDSPDW